MYAGNTEVHPLIARSPHAPLDINAILATVREVRDHAAESAALCEATKARMEMYARDSETLNAIRSSLKAGGYSAAAPASQVQEIIEDDKFIREGFVNLRVWYEAREIMSGSLTERADEYERQSLDTLRAALKLVQRWPANMTPRMTPLDTEPKTAPVKKVA